MVSRAPAQMVCVLLSTERMQKMRYKILSDGKQINIIAADEFFVEDYCTKNGYTFEKIIDPPPEPEPEPEPEPTDTDVLNALLGVSE